ncbi:MAG: ubiquitin-like protein Pup [Acidimicrobiales bacterium]|jgi:ubiquitin-like protein Pup|nr:ubiquitin-like protein Pup [Acidimicrobiales bacterium]MDP6901239.1 ubiquitin-like protein Pup [Acidimicrobiales bacterium]HJL99590.1 ubiquitin-like protein Pup [Acidimicrobiales bacterium]
MAEREQRRRPAPRTDEVEVDDAVSADSGEELKAELDDLLDEIDDVLETNAEEFVKNYVQKGGE